MRETNLAGVDLNLLPALEALLRRRNVTHAAADVGLSQPAMSRALARLRALIGDPLLVRIPGGLAPTPRALALRAPLTVALDGLGGLFRESSFDPASMRRAFHVAATDAQTVLLGPPLLRRLRREAPDVDLRFETYGPDLRERIDDGSMDFAFAVATTPLPPGAASEPVARDRLAIVMRRGHPAAERPWTLSDYADYAHVTVSVRGDGESDIDARLAEAGVTRRIALTTPHFLAALASVGASDCVTTLSEALARRFADAFGLVLKRSPFADSDITLVLVGAALRANDPALAWFRARVREAADEVYGDANAKPPPEG